MDSDQKTLNMATVGANTLARAARTRITSIQAKGIASSTSFLQAIKVGINIYKSRNTIVWY